jgi:CspA family cold shock protein
MASGPVGRLRNGWRALEISKEDADMPQGTVKWFNDTKGFGFLQQDGGGDVFVHHTEINMQGFKTLSEGERVEFELTQGPKGPKALNVRRIS